MVSKDTFRTEQRFGEAF